MSGTGSGMAATVVGHHHRGDIDGLRAVAVVAVVAYHAGVPGAGGGFVGVDVFFVISGYLIMQALLREQEGTGRIALLDFAARRVRRLAPALTTVVLATMAATVLLLSPLRWGTTVIESLWSVTYTSNIGFGLRSSQYFAETASPSPLLHTWSLAVEEQFYVLWPLAMVLAATVARKVRRPPRVAIGVLVAVGLVVSFAASVRLVGRGSPWAYYSLPTRWWEIGIGVGCALWLGGRAPSRSVGTVASVLGVAVLAASFAWIGEDTPFPGVAALGPTVATAALLVAGSGPAGPVARCLAWAPMQQVGRWSYSWYLWHWPVIVLAQATRVVAGPVQTAVVAAASLIPAAITHHVVERPMRFHPRLVASRRGTALAALVGVASVALVGAAVTGLRGVRMDDPQLRHLESIVNARSAAIHDYCWADGGERSMAACDRGTGAFMLIGDSHAQHWLPAARDVADRLGRPLSVRTRGGCPAWRMAVAVTASMTHSVACDEFVELTYDEIERTQPAAVIVASASYEGLLVDGTGGLAEVGDEPALWRAGVERTVEAMRRRGVPMGVVLDNPWVPFDPVECLAQEGVADRCRFDRGEAMRRVTPARRVQSEVLERLGQPTPFDPVPAICAARSCAVASGDRVTFADPNHLTEEFVRAQVPDLVGLVERVAASGTGGRGEAPTRR